MTESTTPTTRQRHIGIANYSEDGWGPKPVPLRLVVTLELRVGDSAGDLAERGFRTTELEPCPPSALTLSATHDLIRRDRPRHSDSALISCGASLPDVPAGATFDPEWDQGKYAYLQSMANRWHLNTMSPGCVHQIAEGWNTRPIDPTKPTRAYGRHFRGQQSDSWNMLTWVRRDEHPEGLLSFPCPTCGYKYGSAWLVEIMPAEVLEYFSDLIA